VIAFYYQKADIEDNFKIEVASQAEQQLEAPMLPPRAVPD
jgi:hypothetical protein